MLARDQFARRRWTVATTLALASLLLVASCSVRRAAPPLSLETWSDPPVVGQGRTFVLWVRPSAPLKELTGRWGEREVKFYQVAVGEENLHRSLLGVPMDIIPGEYTIEVEAISQSGGRIGRQMILTVRETDFVEEQISIPSQKSGYLTSQYLAKEARAIRNAMTDSDENQLWKGMFIPSAEGRISSPFGARRVYNDGTARWRHKGTDIANKEGTAILAPNSGTVVLSEPMVVHGETVILDHGQGVFTIYNHFRERFVEVGDTVQKGETIGLMGETGLATGSHLHWGLYVAGVAVDPLEWTERWMDRAP